MLTHLPARIAGERRRVTILFADLAGFTALAERLDPEEALVLVNTCFDALAPVVERYGGAVDKFIGDELMALFGAPEAHEDDVERALRAALEMRQVLSVLDAWQGQSLGLHIGINTGLAVAGGIGSRGRQTYSVIGDPVNVAARILNQSQAGEILVGPETYRQAAQLFEFEPLSPLSLKGKAEPVTVYRLLGLRRRPVTLRGLPGLHSPLVGRESEMQKLLRLAEGLRRGRGAAVLLLGEAGAGKSRLINEWRNALETAAATNEAGAFRWSGVHCPSYGRDAAYQAVVGLLQALLGGGAEGSSQTLEQLLAECCTHSMDAHAPYLAHLLSLAGPAQPEGRLNLQALEPQALKARYAQALRELLRGLASQSPLVLVLEDFHWADASSVDLFIRLLPLLEQAPLLLCLVARPDAEAPAWRLVEALQTYVAARRGLRLELTSLPEAESRRLVANLLDLNGPVNGPAQSAWLEDLYRLVLARSDGNPFFIEELVRILLDSGALSPDEAARSSGLELENLQIPDNLQGLLMGRVDRLLPPLRVALRLAAVIGRRFELPLLQAALEQEDWQWPGGLSAALQELEQRGLVRPSQAADQSAAPAYIFQHTLLQEAAYQSLLHQERRRLHLLVGELLERSLGEQKQVGATQAQPLALHFERAGAANRAWPYDQLAGQSAYRRYGLAEAIQHFQRALELARRPEAGASPADLQSLALDGGRCLELSARYPQALALYQEMEALARRLSAPAFELAMLVEQAKLYATPTPLNDPTLGLSTSERALTLARTLGDEAAEARLEWILVVLGWIRRDSAFSRLHAERSLEIARRLNLREQLAYSLHDAHRAYVNVDNPRALNYLLEARQLWRQLGNQAMLADTLCSTADLYQHSLPLEAAFNLAVEAYHLSRSIDNGWNQAYAACLLGEIEIERAHLAAAVAHLRECLQVSRQAGVMILFNRALDVLWQLYLLWLGDLPAAAALLDEMVQTLSGEMDSRQPFQAVPYRLLFESYRCRLILRQPGPPAQRLQQAQTRFDALWRDLLALYPDGLPGRLSLYRLRTTQSEILAAAGDYQAALDVLVDLQRDPYLRLFGRFAMTLDLPHIYTLARLGRLDEARRLAQELWPKLAPDWRLARCLALSMLAEVEALSGNQAEAQDWRRQADLLTGEIADQLELPQWRAGFLRQARQPGLLPP